jgi:hypothetical protein
MQGFGHSDPVLSDRNLPWRLSCRMRTLDRTARLGRIHRLFPGADGCGRWFKTGSPPMTWVAILMGVIVFFSLSLGGADLDFSSAMISGIFALAGGLVLAFPISRDGAINALWRHRFGAIGLLTLVMYAVNAVGGLGAPAFSSAPHATAANAWTFATLGFAAIAAAGAAKAAGRDRLLLVLLATPIVLAIAILVDQLDQVGDFFGLFSGAGQAGRGLTGPFATAAELGAVYALFILLGAFAALDEVRRRPTPGMVRFPPLSRRLLLPVGSILISLNVLAVSGSRGAMVAAVVGVAVMWAIMTARLGPGLNRAMPMPAYAAIGASAAAVVMILASPLFELIFAVGGDGRPYAYLNDIVARASTEQPWIGYGFGAFPQVSADLMPVDASLSGFTPASADLAVWRVEAGVIGVTLGLLALLGFLIPLGLMKDRGRAPSRGLALGVGVLVVCVIAGVPHAVLANPAIAHMCAVLLGLSAMFVDDARRKPAPGYGMPAHL